MPGSRIEGEELRRPGGPLAAPRGFARAEIEARTAAGGLRFIEELLKEERAVELVIAGEARMVAVEDAARYRDALGTALPEGIPQALLGEVEDALCGLLARFARRRGPFTTRAAADRLGISPSRAEAALRSLLNRGRLLEGAFLPGGREREWCDPEALRALRRRSLSLLREEVEPVEPAALSRALQSWHGIPAGRSFPDGLVSALEKLQGAPLAASILESEVLPARVKGYLPGDLDALAARGEVVWVGLEQVGERDGRVALYLSDALPRLYRREAERGPSSERERRILSHLSARGASFFPEIHDAVGGGFAQETVDALWGLCWRGLLTNDTLQPLRAYAAGPEVVRRRERSRHGVMAYPSRLKVPPSAGGRWTLLEARLSTPPTPTEWSLANVYQLLARYGVVTREAVIAEGLPGGFQAVYPVLRHLEESGRVRRGYFVAGVGAMQFALPLALDGLRAAREPPAEAEVVVLAAGDPANPWGSLLAWPPLPGESALRRPTRAPGARVVLVDGAPAVQLGGARGLEQLLVWLPLEEPDRSRVGAAAAKALWSLGVLARARDEGVRVEEVNGVPASGHPFADFLRRVGFSPSGGSMLFSRGLLHEPSSALPPE